MAIVPPLLFGGVWSDWIYKGLAILLIGCPCALVISMPAAIAAGLSAGARRGLLMKGGAVLETIGKVTMVAFDKTGTLTEGKPRSPTWSPSAAARPRCCRRRALETGRAIRWPRRSCRAAAAKVVAPSAAGLAAIGGKGVVGTVDGVEWFLGSPNAAEARGANLTPQ